MPSEVVGQMEDDMEEHPPRIVDFAIYYLQVNPFSVAARISWDETHAIELFRERGMRFN